ncbi:MULTISPECIES: hypothetical protein [Bacillus cereus group]|uniref:Uncharacterized protein n=1 Tax=Bacillus cereus TaxID=1396 RepID=A0AA44QA95_BACCE|nr:MULTISPECIES: hypothetical protein [Bacillus cereus group]PFA17705.1 hypothetical protein CN373_19810 [Bacillus cereus]PFN01965.1 hypothetical protein COJ55_24340 [Bacillus cereus]PFO78068.1 hypothetical protein COJ77_21515 [Bacillus cereus]PFR20783.1 hypothetical protein COK19_22765 [Bacillus cereus]PFS01272.1 hypothetical protein COK38_12170 [Bacillus cereus]
MFEDKSKVNYPYEFAETVTIPIKKPNYSKFKNSTNAQPLVISKHYVEKLLYSERIDTPKNK